ncbi:MAG TPA: choice-of-anchor Q domain-containing protein, partial [Terriglobales bacterium]|nr:choice-of-anchor Q domain-containing protein [Terriglobales bacterium]
IGVSLKILGANASTTIIDGGSVNTVVIISSSSANVTLSKLTIRNGYATLGGGIINIGTLTLNNCTITANSAQYGGGGIDNYGMLTINHSAITASNLYQYSSGGAIMNWSALTINKSTISGNSAASGGGIFSGCCSSLSTTVTTINDSTVSGNSATGTGGGMLIISGTATINNGTISGNSAAQGGGILNYVPMTINNSTIGGNSAAIGGGIEQAADYGGSVIQNSIIANNSGGNCLGTISSNGYNLSSDNTCYFNGPGDMNNTNPKLGTLGNYGGPTQTIPLRYRSPAIDAGNPNGCTDGSGNLLKTDQRGAPRPDPEDTGGCDIGAFERQMPQDH